MTKPSKESEIARLSDRREVKRQQFQHGQERALKQGGELATASGRLVLHGKLLRLIDSVEADFTRFLATKMYASPGGRAKGWLRKLKKADLRVMIAVAAVTIFERALHLDEDVSVGRISRAAGEAVTREHVLLTLKRDYPRAYDAHISNQLGRGRLTWGFFRAHFERQYGIPVTTQELDYELRNMIGQVFCESILRHSDLLEVFRTSKRRGHQLVQCLLVRPTPRMYEEMADIHSHLLQAIEHEYAPLRVPPDEWTAPDQGGYPNHAFLLMKGMREPNECPSLSDTPELYRAVNAHQAVPWQIREHTADLMCELWDSNALVGDFPSREPLDVPPEMKPEEWKALAPDVRRRNSLVRRLALRQERTNVSQRARLTQLTNTIKESRDGGLWFPATVDFRGRMYSTYPFGPQGHDRVRSVLEFARGQQIETPEALDWLKIHGANVYGIKGTFKERLAWVDSTTAERKSLLDVGPDGPARHWWNEASSPWQVYSWADELRRAEAGEAVRMPVSLDGTCHGIQIWSLLLRDAEMAASVNVIDSPGSPHDLYSVMADRIVEFLESCDDRRADLLLELGIDRTFAKPLLMALPFGMTIPAIGRKIQDALDEHYAHPSNYHYKAAAWLAAPVYRMAQEVSGSTIAGLKWLKTYARAAVKAGENPTWFNPLGLEVTQRYRVPKSEMVRLGSLGCEYRLRHLSLTPELNTQMNTRSISANYIHSVDSALMMMSLNKAVDAGVNDFSMIHDCYGVHPNDATTMMTAAREAVVEMFSISHLDALAHEAETRYSVSLEPPPMVDTLDVTDALVSPYFFS